MKTWNNKLKLAIINEDELQIASLIKEMPIESTEEELIEASALVQEAIKLIDEKKEKLGQEMTKLRKAKQFLKNQ